jgi:GTP-binding protein
MATTAKIIDQNLPTVALVGRVNVGKSTLFNKMTESNKALVSSIPGTTRTRNIDTVSWRGRNFRLVDTGGLTFSEDIPLEKEIIKQTELALREADLILFVVDLKTGVLPQEKELTKRLRKEKTKIILVGNKADNQKIATLSYDQQWLGLGMGKPFPVSAANGSNIGDLLDEVYKKLGRTGKKPKILKTAHPIKVAIIGKPNVGKSSLFNDLIGKEQVIVSDLPHTTREPHDTLVESDGQPMLFVDTAGIRRKSKVHGELEVQGVGKSIEMIKKSDIVLLVIDASEFISTQDQQLAGLLRENTKSVIIVVNKWDKTEDNSDQFRNEAKQKVYAAFPHLDFAPIVFVSAKTQYRVHQIFPLIMQAWKERHIEIPEDELKVFMKKVTHEHRPSRGKGTRHPEIIAFHQLRSNPPIFEMQIKFKTSVHFSYVHYIENRLREKYGFVAAPIVIKLTKLKRML